MHRFYAPEICDTLTLPEVESGHCVRVLRLKEGDEIEVVDGNGNCHLCRISLAHHKRCAVEIVSTEHETPHWGSSITIAIAPTKNLDRMEWMVEKCTEIGIDEITPLLCRFSERKTLRTDRLEKIILSAAKQSLTPYLPVLHELTDYESFMREYARDRHTGTDKFIAHCYKEDKRLLKDLIIRGRDVLVLIGPEGDFSEQEVHTALSEGFRPVSLGNSRLRTETAGVVACHTAILLNE